MGNLLPYILEESEDLDNDSLVTFNIHLQQSKDEQSVKEFHELDEAAQQALVELIVQDNVSEKTREKMVKCLLGENEPNKNTEAIKKHLTKLAQQQEKWLSSSLIATQPSLINKTQGTKSVVIECGAQLKLG